MAHPFSCLVNSTEHLLCSSTTPGIGYAEKNQVFRDHLVGKVVLQSDSGWSAQKEAVWWVGMGGLWGLIQNSL